jgi:hypothetical protein
MSRAEKLRAIAERTGKPLHWYGYAMELRASGALEEARDVFGRVHGLDGDYHPAYFMRAQVHEELAEIDEARGALEIGIAKALAAGDDDAVREMRAMLDVLPE